MATPAQKLQNDKGTQGTVHFLSGGGLVGFEGGGGGHKKYGFIGRVKRKNIGFNGGLRKDPLSNDI